MEKIYKGRGRKEDTRRLIELLDDVFFLEDDEQTRRNFLELIPKLYKDKYNPAYNNVIIAEGDEIKAAVGCYPIDAAAAGRELKILGIGNVAVARDSRSKGYMIECMNMALDIMKQGGYDYSLLGGHRQRYAYFGFEPAGLSYRFSINRKNIDHILGRDAATTLTAREITENDVDVIKRIKAINDSQPYHAVRAEEALVDILKTWRCVPYAAFEGDEFKGYFTAEKFGGINELKAENTQDTLNLIMCAMQTLGCESVSFAVPVFDDELCSYMVKNCGGYSLGDCGKLSILNYARFVEAFLAVKASRMNLCPGSLTLLIHGIKGDEQIKITVDGKNVSVTHDSGKSDFEFEHLEAIEFLAGIYSGRRLELPAFAQGWFPLDYFIASQDDV